MGVCAVGFCNVCVRRWVNEETVPHEKHGREEPRDYREWRLDAACGERGREADAEDGNQNEDAVVVVHWLWLSVSFSGNVESVCVDEDGCVVLPLFVRCWFAFLPRPDGDWLDVAFRFQVTVLVWDGFD